MASSLALLASAAGLSHAASAQESAPFPAPDSSQTVAPGETAPVVTVSDGAGINDATGWSFKPRGRIQLDAGVVDTPDGSGLPDGSGEEVRRARLGFSGTTPGDFGFKVEVDFASGSVEFADAVITRQVGNVELTVGQHNNFQSLEEVTSSLHTSFLERAAFTDAFGFQRRLGVSAQYLKSDLLLQAGVFGQPIDSDGDRDWSFDARAVYMPRIGGTQLHLGGSAHRARLNEGEALRFRQRPGVHFTDQRFIDTGRFAAESETGFGLEAAAIAGRFHFAAEGFRQSVDRPVAADASFFGGYVEAGYFLTKGDRRGYKDGKFDRIRPERPVTEGGVGAVQLNVRYDYLDLVDEDIVGGKQNALGLALIWAPTANTRLMAEYERLSYDFAEPTLTGDTSYRVDAFGVRAQFDF
nr:porin [Alteripontixanthobacter muriae]